MPGILKRNIPSQAGQIQLMISGNFSKKFASSSLGQTVNVEQMSLNVVSDNSPHGLKMSVVENARQIRHITDMKP